MKTKLIIATAAYICLSSVGSAFSLDFTGVALGTPVPPNLTITVPGYGDVTFSALPGSSLSVESFTGTPALAFDQGESVQITFTGAAITDLAFNFAGVSPGESFLFLDGGSSTFVGNLQGVGDGAGISGLTWNTVPEPSSALLGVLGASLLVLRRRR